MKRRIISLLLLVVFMATPHLSVDAAYFLPGPTSYVMEEKYCTDSSGVEMSGGQITVSGEGNITYDYYISFDVGTIEISYAEGATGSVTIELDGLGTQTMAIDEEKTAITFTLATAQRRGDHIINLGFTGNMTITAITLKAKGWAFDFADTAFVNWSSPNLSDEEWAIHTAFIVKTDASIVMVNGSRRFIDEQDMNARPLNVNGTIYLPIKVLAYALGYYHEDMPDKNYFLMRYEQMTFTYKYGVLTKQVGHGETEQIEAPMQVSGGVTWLPVQFYAAQAGKTVLSKNGIIVCESSKHLANEIVNNQTNLDYVAAEFAPFTVVGAVGTTYHVSKSGNDENEGTEASPFVTINKAAEVATAGDTVIIHGGTYRELVTVQNDGTETSPITFKAAEGETVTINAADVIDEFTGKADGTCEAAVSWDLGRGKNQVFYDNECIVEARYPNGPGIEMSEGRELSSLYPVVGDFFLPDEDVDGTPNKHLVTSETLLNQEEDDYWKGATYVSMHGYGWTLLTAIVESSTKGSMRLGDDRFSFYWNYSAKVQSKMDFGYITGHKNAMDLPGEWVMEGNVLSIIPPEGETAESLSVEVKRRQLCLDMSNRKFVQVKGINFIGGSIKMTDSEMCMLDSINAKYTNHFTHNLDAREGFIDDYSDEARMSGDGAILRGETGIFVSGTDNYIINSRIDHGAGAGLNLAGVYTYVENNVISNTGYMGTYVSGINVCTEPYKAVRTPRGGHGIYHNTVYNAGRSVYNVYAPEGLPGDWAQMWNAAFLPIETAYNDFHDGILFSLDTGVTYEYHSLARTERAESKMHHNYVYTTTPKTNPFGLGIYHDGATVGYGTYDNIAFTTEKDTIYSNTYVVKTPSGVKKANFVRRNMELYAESVNGGPTGLTTEQFPYNQPFYAGSYQDMDEFMRNYNNEAATGEIYQAKNATLSSGAELDENGRAVLNAAGEYVEFKNVDMTAEGKNLLSYYYSADGLIGSTKFKIGVGSDAETAQYNIGSTKSLTISKDELDVDYMTFPVETGVTNVYFSFISGAPIAIDSVVLRSNDLKSVKHDATQVWGGAFDRITKVTSGTIPSAVNDGPGGNPYARDTWGGNQLVYNNIKIPENAGYLYFAAGTPTGYSGQTITFSYQREGDVTNTKIVSGVTRTNTWNTYDDYVYMKLPEDIPLGEEVDIIVDFSGAGTCNFYSFGFMSMLELPSPKFTLDLSSYETNQTIKNGMTNSSEGIRVLKKQNKIINEVNQVVTLDGPQLKEYYTDSGDVINTLALSKKPTTEGGDASVKENNYLGVIELSADALTEIFGNDGTDAANNGDEMTVSFWVKNYAHTFDCTNDYKFRYYNGMSAYTYKNAMQLKPLDTESVLPYNAGYTADTWSFYTISRKWIQDENAETGTWACLATGNGAAFSGVGSLAGKTSVDYTGRAHTDMTEKTLTIGGAGDSMTEIISQVLVGEIADFTIYDKSLTLEETVQEYNNEKDKYKFLTERVDLPESLNLISPASGLVRDINNESGKLVLRFNNLLDKETVEGAITLTDERGFSAPNFSVTASGKEAVVNYGTLIADKTYTLRVTNALKSVNDIAAEEATITLKVTNENIPVFSLDLSSYDDTEEVPIVKNKLTGSSDGITVYKHANNRKGTNGPTLIKYYNKVTGEEIEAIQPATDPKVTNYINPDTGLAASNLSNYLGTIGISANAMTAMFGNTAQTAQYNGDAMTISFWVKDYAVPSSNDNNFKYDGLMKIYKYGSTKFELHTDTGTAFFYSPTANEWHLYTISRKWEQNESDKNGTLTYYMMLDGHEITSQGNINISTNIFENIEHRDNSASTLHIGGDSATKMITYGEIADFNIYDKVLTAEEMTAIYTEKAPTFATKNLTTAENMPTTLVASESLIDTSLQEGSFDVSFNNIIDASTVADGIKLYAADGETLMDKFSVTANGTKVTVKHKDLEIGKIYKLKINDSLKSIVPGVTTTASEITIYSSENPIRTISLNSALENMNMGAFPTDTDWYTYVRSNGENSFTVASKTLTDESTIKYLKIKSEKYNGVSLFGNQIPTGYEDLFMLDLKVQVTGSATQRGVYFNEDVSVSGKKNDALELKQYDTDTDGFVDVRYIFEKIDSTYKVTRIGMIDGEETTESNVVNIPSGWNNRILLKSYHYSLTEGGTATPEADLNVAEFKLSLYDGINITPPFIATIKSITDNVVSIEATTEKEATLFLASYKDNRLIAVTPVPVSIAAGTNDYTVTGFNKGLGTMVRAFLWDTVTEMNPLCVSK